MKFLYKFASRSRPDKFIKCVENIYINSRNKDFIILASLDEDDKYMNNESMIEKMKLYPKIYPVFGKSKNKIDAINRDIYMMPEWDIIMNMSDDILFIAEGYDAIIENDMKKYFPDGDCILHYPDQNQGENCMTMNIMDKKYYQRFNYIYHPDYISLWCDKESEDVGKILGRYKYIPTHIFNHYHPSFGQTTYDAQYLKTEAWDLRNKDEQTYFNRKKNNFYL